MKQIEYKPLQYTTVILHQLHRGDCKKFIEDMLLNNYHVFEFALDGFDARAIFYKMKLIAKTNREKVHFSSNHGAWFIQVIDKVVLYKRNGQYILQVNSYRN